MADGAMSGIVAVPSGPTIPITSDGGQGAGATQSPTFVNRDPASQTQGQTQGSPWGVKDPELLKVVQSKKWSDPEQAIKSYVELEREFHKGRTESAEMRQILEAIAPHWGDIQAFLTERQQKAAQQKVADDKTGQPDIQRLLDQALSPFKQQMESVTNAQRRTLVNQATKSFMDAYPDAKDIEDKIAEVINKRVVNVADPNDPDSVFQTMEAAYNIVKAGQLTKKAAGQRASAVEGGGTQKADPNTRNLNLAQLKEMILNEGSGE